MATEDVVILITDCWLKKADNLCNFLMQVLTNCHVVCVFHSGTVSSSSFGGLAVQPAQCLKNLWKYRHFMVACIFLHPYYRTAFPNIRIVNPIGPSLIRG